LQPALCVCSVPGRECTGECAADEETPADRSAGVYQGASSEGEKVFFTSSQPLMDAATGGGPYLYVESLAQNGQGSRVTSLSLAGSEVEGVAAIAQDGSRVYFRSGAVLAGANANGEVPVLHGSNLYVYDTESGGTAFVTQGGSPFQGSPNGQYAVFYSGNPIPGTNNTSTTPQLFEYEAATGRVARVSSGQHSPGVLYECAATKTMEAGYNCDGNINNSEEGPLTTRLIFGEKIAQKRNEPGAAVSRLTVANDGTVVFASPLALTPQALPGRVLVTEFGEVSIRTENVYEYSSGNVYLISPADEAAPIHYDVRLEESRLLGIDESGDNVFFGTADGLVPQDGDTQQSWYDARVCVVESARGGPGVLEYRERILARLACVIDGGRRESARAGECPPLVAEGLAGAGASILYTRLLNGERKPLAGLLNELVAMIVLPYQGPAAARRERTRPVPAAPSLPGWGGASRSRLKGPARPASRATHASDRGRRDAPPIATLEEIPMRLTYRTARVLEVIAARSGVSNREVAAGAGITDEGQISKLLARLERLGLTVNTGQGHARGETNAWSLTPLGLRVTQCIAVSARDQKEAA